MVGCPKCGALNDEHAGFCSLCLQKFDNQTVVENNQLAPDISSDLHPPPQHEEFAYQSIEDKLFKPPITFTAPFDLLSQTFNFLTAHIMIYIKLSIVFLLVVFVWLVTIFSTAGLALTDLLKNTGPQTNTLPSIPLGTIAPLAALSIPFFIICRLYPFVLMLATRGLCRGKNLGISRAFFEVAMKTHSLLWISFLQALASGSVMFFGFAIFAATRFSSPAILIISLVFGMPFAVIFGIWFSMAACLCLDRDKKGLDALLCSKSLVGERVMGVLWRFSVLGFAVSVLQMIPIVGSLAALVVTPAYSIFIWLLYRNLCELNGSQIETSENTLMIGKHALQI